MGLYAVSPTAVDAVVPRDPTCLNLQKCRRLTAEFSNGHDLIIAIARRLRITAIDKFSVYIENSLFSVKF